MSTTRTVHFGALPYDPPATESKDHSRKPAKQADPKPQPNIMQCFGDALRDAELMREKLRGLVSSHARHGDLQVALSAAKRVEEALKVLISAEEL